MLTTISPELNCYYGPLVTVSSAFSFYVVSRLVSLVGIPQTGSQSVNKKNTWRFKNIFVSWIHSFITGVWAISCFYLTPVMAEDLITTYTTFSVTLVAISTGYFVHDCLDMVLYSRTVQSLELIIHHCVVTFCFGISVIKHMFIGYAVVALIVELNGIFLHLRQLLQICGIPKDSRVYRLNSLLNIGTFVVFRIFTLTWMTRWLVYNRGAVSLGFYTIGCLGMALITVMNIILFYRILKSDFFRHTKDKLKV